MAAAALGNTISDVIGIGSAFYVEKLAEMSGVRPPKLTPIQLEMKASRRAANLVSFKRSVTVLIVPLLITCLLSTGSRVGHHNRMPAGDVPVAVHEGRGQGGQEEG